MSLLSPSAVAVIGASADEGSVGHDIFKNLLTQGFEGSVYPVNPKRTHILDVPCFASVRDIPEEIDLAIIVVPAKIVPPVLQECIEKSIEYIVIISAGFGETETETEEGHLLELKIQQIVQNAPKPITVLGPNCLGILRPSTHLNASFASDIPPNGSVALLSQSGAMAVAVMDASKELGIGYSTVLSIGNKTITDEADLLKLLAQDDQTTVIGLYLESINDGKKFLKTAKEVGITKKIVLLKAGVSDQGKKAAASHTGALAGSDKAIDALCAQANITRAKNMQEFLDALEGLSTCPSLLSRRIAIVTNAGGPGILATDAAAEYRLTLPTLQPHIKEELQKQLPSTAATNNPIDVIGDAKADRYKAALKAAGEDPHIDGICVIMTPQVMTPCEDIAQEIIQFHKTHPLIPIVTAFLGEEHIEPARTIVQDAHIPCYETPERAIAVLSSLYQPTPLQGHTPYKNASKERQQKAQKLLQKRTNVLPETIVEQLFSLYDIPLPPQTLVSSKEEAIHAAESMGYPVVAKLSSVVALHKTDIDGVRANLDSPQKVQNAFSHLEKIVNNTVMVQKVPSESILIQKQLPPAIECIVGATKDDAFGHLILVGMGGIYAEILNDTSARIAPFSSEEAFTMLQELSAWDIFRGARGQRPLHVEQMAHILVALSELVHDCPQIQDIDCNPVFLTEHNAIVVDAKITLA